jgi:hypothetical protein
MAVEHASFLLTKLDHNYTNTIAAKQKKIGVLIIVYCNELIESSLIRLMFGLNGSSVNLCF